MQFTIPDHSGDQVREFDFDANDPTILDAARAVFDQLRDDGRSPIEQPAGRRVESIDDLAADTAEVHFLVPWQGG